MFIIKASNKNYVNILVFHSFDPKFNDPSKAPEVIYEYFYHEVLPCQQMYDIIYSQITFVRRSCRFPLYHVITAFGLEPVLSHITSYLLSATSVAGGLLISTVSGFTINYAKDFRNLNFPRSFHKNYLSKPSSLVT